MDAIVPFLIIIVLILINGLFVAAEFAIIGVRSTRMTQLAEDGNRTAAHIAKILSDAHLQDRYIATAQLGVTLASLGLGMYGEHTIADLLLGPFESVIHLDETTAHAVAAFTSLALLTFAHVVIGEMVPKSLALQYAERTVLSISALMRLSETIFSPAVAVLNAIGNMFLRLFGIPVSSGSTLYSPEEIELLVTESHEGGLLSDNQEQLLHNIFDFGERRVGQVMTPRVRLQALELSTPIETIRQKLSASPHSRFPVYDRDIDHVIGVLHIKDFVRYELEPAPLFHLQSLLRPLPVVPENMLVERLLPQFKRTHNHIALVVDEYGGTVGIVTLEDLVEEVVGEVHDEFDQAEREPINHVAPGVIVARGNVLLDDLREYEDLPIPDEEDLDVDTIGGLVVSHLGRPPQVGDEITMPNMLLKVEAVEGYAVGEVRITTTSSATSETAERSNKDQH